MITKKELEEYRLNNEYIRKEKLRIQEMLEQTQKITSTLSFTHTSNGVSDKFAEVLATMMDMQKNTMQSVLRQEQRLIHIRDSLEQLDQPYKNILYSRYIEGKDLVEVAVEISKGYEWTCRLHGIALEMLKKY